MISQLHCHEEEEYVNRYFLLFSKIIGVVNIHNIMQIKSRIHAIESVAIYTTTFIHIIQITHIQTHTHARIQKQTFTTRHRIYKLQEDCVRRRHILFLCF